MRSMKTDGGPAFPRALSSDPQQGMFLRDYFAARAMQGLIASNDGGAGDRIQDIAWYAYQIADAMLAERENDQEENRKSRRIEEDGKMGRRKIWFVRRRDSDGAVVEEEFFETEEDAGAFFYHLAYDDTIERLLTEEEMWERGWVFDSREVHPPGIDPEKVWE